MLLKNLWQRCKRIYVWTILCEFVCFWLIWKALADNPSTKSGIFSWQKSFFFSEHFDEEILIYFFGFSKSSYFQCPLLKWNHSRFTRATNIFFLHFLLFFYSNLNQIIYIVSFFSPILCPFCCCCYYDVHRTQDTLFYW